MPIKKDNDVYLVKFHGTSRGYVFLPSCVAGKKIKITIVEEKED